MHQYSTFWIKDEFHYHYFYKSDILRRFLTECLTFSYTNKQLKDQFDFITQEIPYKLLLQHVKSFHKQQLDVIIKGEILEMIKGNRAVTISFHKRFFTIHAHSLEEADDLIFQPLKSLHPSFFIIEKDSTNSGWVSPVKNEVLL
ncbi:sporulation inhibitor of replication protein SirA [Aquibacillus sediminis]|uniref:sporulation inhibitor of replication protein SirA n=1 Tax=Aquibacillus sediminis TaxID=2574734 RepID=UPI001109C0D7|nr:sporulation inhibitor of replication protein SirA [Aquibacillus sediminis]